MNRENYDPKFISNGEVMGAYFLNIFYNELYIKARRSVAAGKHGSTTDAYRAMVANYIYGIENVELCNRVVQGLHKYYQDNTNYSVISLADFESKVLSQFIPAEYFRDFTGRDKDSNLCAIIRHVVSSFGNKLLEKRYLSMVIDERKVSSNVRVLQDVVLDILIMQREEYYTNFARKITQKSHMVSGEVVEKLRNALIEMTRKKCEAEQERDTALNILKQVAIKVRDAGVTLGESHNRNGSANMAASADSFEKRSNMKTNAVRSHDIAKNNEMMVGSSHNAGGKSGVLTNAAVNVSANTQHAPASILSTLSTLNPANILSTPPRGQLLNENEINRALEEVSRAHLVPSAVNMPTVVPTTNTSTSERIDIDDDDSADEPDYQVEQRKKILERFSKAPVEEIGDLW